MKAYSISRVQLEEDKGTKGLVYAYKFMLIARQSQPDSPDGKMTRFGFCAASSLIWVGWGFAVTFYSFEDCNLRKIGTPPPPPNQGWALMARLGFARLHPWFEARRGGGGEEWRFAVPFYSVQDCSFRSALGALGASLCAWPKMSSSSGRELILSRTFWNRKNNFSPPF